RSVAGGPDEARRVSGEDLGLLPFRWNRRHPRRGTKVPIKGDPGAGRATIWILDPRPSPLTRLAGDDRLCLVKKSATPGLYSAASASMKPPDWRFHSPA